MHFEKCRHFYWEIGRDITFLSHTFYILIIIKHNQKPMKVLKILKDNVLIKTFFLLSYILSSYSFFILFSFFILLLIFRSFIANEIPLGTFNISCKLLYVPSMVVFNFYDILDFFVLRFYFTLLVTSGNEVKKLALYNIMFV